MTQKKSYFQRNSGVTLVEIVVVIAVFSLLLAMAVPSFDSFRQRQKVRNALHNIATLLLNSRFAALKTNSAAVIEFSAGSCHAFLDNGNGSHKKDWLQQSEEQTIDDVSIEPGLTLTNNCNQPTHPDKFRYTGRVRVSPCTITIAAGGEDQGRVIINAVGRVRTEKLW